MNMNTLIQKLRNQGVTFTNGLSDLEVVEIQSRYEITFPPDLKTFLQTALPISSGFVDWRNSNPNHVKKIQSVLKAPLEGIIFDIKHNDFWHDDWGTKPSDQQLAIEICSRYVHQAPTLIPIYSHRYIPSSPDQQGNPVFSVYQTDIIYYGANIIQYLLIEFGLKKYKEVNDEPIEYIPFWSDLVGY